jgi:hypothetical protein
VDARRELGHQAFQLADARLESFDALRLLAFAVGTCIAQPPRASMLLDLFRVYALEVATRAVLEPEAVLGAPTTRDHAVRRGEVEILELVAAERASRRR